MSARVPAVAYLRRSDDSESQEKSIPEQREAVQQYAQEKGYRIVREYVDDAISGDDTGNRTQFLQMMADARELGDYKAILCWDKKRFARFDSLEYGYHVHPLRKAGVYLATVVDGVADWNDASGRIVATVMQEGAHQQLLDHSANVARGQLGAANNGGWIGSPPYAYRLEGPKKRKRLVIDDPGHVAIVQRIFRQYVDDGLSMHEIAKRLNEEGVISPGGRVKGWRFDSVKVILENPAYTGDFAACRWSYGKYHRIKDGRVGKSSGRSRNPEAEWIVRKDHHEAIIDRDLFGRAQDILAKGKRGPTRHPPETNPYALSRLLRCGRCGTTLQGFTAGKHRYYHCHNRKYNGPEACEGTTVRESRVLNEVADHLERWLGFDLDPKAFGAGAFYGALTESDVPEAFAKVRNLIAPPRPQQDHKALEKQAKSLGEKIDKARRNLILLDPENIPTAQEEIKRLQAERERLEAEVRRKPPSDGEISAVVLDTIHNLYSLAYCCRVLSQPQWVGADGRRGVDNGDGTVTVGSLEKAAPGMVRRFLNRASHIVCHTRVKGRKTVIRHEFERGEIVFRIVGGVTGDVKVTRYLPYSTHLSIPFGPGTY